MCIFESGRWSHPDYQIRTRVREQRGLIGILSRLKLNPINLNFSFNNHGFGVYDELVYYEYICHGALGGSEFSD